MNQRGFVTDAIFFAKLAAGAVALVALWWLWGIFTTWIQAPVQEKLNQAIESRDAWKETATEEKRQRGLLDVLMLKQGRNDAAIRSELEGVKNEIRKLAERDPEVAAWLRAGVPGGIVGLSVGPQRPPAATVLRDTGVNPPNGPGPAPDGGQAQPDQRGPAAGAERPQGSPQNVQRQTGISGYLGKVWSTLTGKMKGATP